MGLKMLKRDYRPRPFSRKRTLDGAHVPMHLISEEAALRNISKYAALDRARTAEGNYKSYQDAVELADEEIKKEITKGFVCVARRRAGFNFRSRNAHVSRHAWKPRVNQPLTPHRY